MICLLALLHILTLVTCCLFATFLTFLQNTTLKNYKEAQIKQQKFVAELQVAIPVSSFLKSCSKGYNGLLQSWPAIFFTLFAGPLSEDYGRKPLIIVGLLGYIVLNIAFFINSWFMYELKAEYLLFECLQDLFGGDIVFSLGIYSLLVDKTEPEARTRRMSILQVSPFCSISSRFVCSLILLFLRLSCLWG